MLLCIEPYKECCFRMKDGRCDALNDVNFRDGQCHFRKRTPYGENLYDEQLKKNKNPG